MITCPECHAQLNENAQFCGHCGKALPAENAAKAHDSFIGKCIDKKYYVRELIASGGMGEVYLAIQKPARQEVAIKKLHEEYYRDKNVVERFMNEAHSYARVTHPNAVKLYDLLNINGQICIVMEFVHGKTLTSYIEAGYVFSPRQIIDISLQIADALGTVHQAGIIHRDLKTENIMLMETVPGRFSVKILDFGIAKFKDPGNKLQTQEGILVGTPEFMSPEQCYGENIDHRSDIYSFGILMYVMVCSRLPFTSDTAMGLLQKQVGEATPPCTRTNGSEIPPGFEAIIRKCMEKKPDDRYQSFADVIVDLECLQEHKETSIAVTMSSLNEALEDDKENAHEKAKDDELKLGQSGDFHFSIESERAISLDDISLSDEREKVSRDSLAIIEPIDDDEDDSGDEEGFSLGDIQELDEEPPESRETEKKKGGHGGVIAFVIVLLLAGLGATSWMFKTGRLDADAMGIPLPDFLKPNVETVAADDPANSDNANNNAEAGNDKATDETGKLDTAVALPPDVPAEVPVVEAVEPDPVPPCQIVTHEIMEQSIGTVMMDKSEALLNEGNLNDANEFLQSSQKKRDILSSVQNARLDTLIASHTAYKDVLAQAEKARKKENCSTISSLVGTVPEEAVGVRTQLEKMANKCNAVLAAPPSTL